MNNTMNEMRRVFFMDSMYPNKNVQRGQRREMTPKWPLIPCWTPLEAFPTLLVVYRTEGGGWNKRKDLKLIIW